MNIIYNILNKTLFRCGRYNNWFVIARITFNNHNLVDTTKSNH